MNPVPVMREAPPAEHAHLRLGAAAAILGAFVSVAAGIGFSNLTNEVSTEDVLQSIAALPPGYWPAVHLAFIVGALLWVGAFVSLAESTTPGSGRGLGWLGVAAMVIGAAIHVIDSSISGSALPALAAAWDSAETSEQANLLRVGDSLLYILHGTWSGVHSYFHGVPFILMGLAVAVSRCYPAWVGWVAVAGGTGSLVGGVLILVGVSAGAGQLFIVFAQIVSLWMVAMGVLMWRRAGGRRVADADSRSGR